MPESLSQFQQCYLFVPNGARHLRVVRAEIMYIEANKTQAIIVTTKATLVVKTNLGSLQSQLADPMFFRASRKYLVNLAHILWLDGAALSVGNQEIVISREQRTALLAKLPVVQVRQDRAKAPFDEPPDSL